MSGLDLFRPLFAVGLTSPSLKQIGGEWYATGSRPGKPSSTSGLEYFYGWGATPEEAIEAASLNQGRDQWKVRHPSNTIAATSGVDILKELGL